MTEELPEVAACREEIPSAPSRGINLTKALPFLLIALGVTLRFFHLGSHSIWADEGFSIFVARMTTPGLIGFITHHDAHPPLFYLLLHQVLTLGDSEFILRIPSAFWGSATILIVYYFTLSLWGRPSALAALFFTALSASQVYCVQEIRMYPLFGALFLGSIYCLYLSVTSRKPWHMAWYVVLVVLMLYTHYMALIALAAHGISLRFLTKDRKTLLLLYALMVLAAVLFLPWLPAMVSQVKSATTPPLPFTPRGAAQFFIATFAGYTFPFSPWDAGEILVLIAACAVPAVAMVALTRRKEGDGALYFLIFNLLFPLLILSLLSLFSIRHLFSIKYLAFTAPLYFMLLARMITTCARPRLRHWMYVFLIFFSIINIMALCNWYFNPFFEKQPWKEALIHVRQNRQEGDALLIQDFFQVHCLQYYLKDDRNIYMIRPEDMAGPLRELCRSHRRIWFLASGGWRWRDPQMKVLTWLSTECTAVEYTEYRNCDDYATVVTGLFERREEKKPEK